MKSPFRTLLRASRMAGKGRPLSAALSLQKLFLIPATPKTKAKAKAKVKVKVKRAKIARPAKPRSAARPAPGTFVEGRFSCAQGSLAYRLYTPRRSTRRRLPLVVMLHGCGQSATDFAAGTGMNRLADEIGFLALYPEQAPLANLARCWNWHRPGDQARGRGEPAVIAALTRQVITIGKAHPDRVYVAGLSAGGATAAIVAAAYPELYVAVGVHSGLLRGDVNTISGAMAAMRHGGADGHGKTARPLPTIVFHGDRDGVVHPSNASGFVSQLRRSSRTLLVDRVERGRSKGGRDYTRTTYRQGGGAVMLEDWTVHGSGHAWSGGGFTGSRTDPAGPDASREMIRFFLARRRPMIAAAIG